MNLSCLIKGHLIDYSNPIRKYRDYSDSKSGYYASIGMNESLYDWEVYACIKCGKEVHKIKRSE